MEIAVFEGGGSLGHCDPKFHVKESRRPPPTILRVGKLDVELTFHVV